MIDIPTLATAEHKANPFPLYVRLRAEAPVVRFIAGDKKPAWLITRYADVSAALKEPRLAKNPFIALTDEERKRTVPWMPGFLRPLSQTMLDQDPPDHGRLRSLVHQAFTPRRVEDLRARVEVIAAELAAQARARGSFDLLEDFAAPLPITVISEMLGVPADERRRFRRWTNRLIRNVTTTDMLLSLPTLWMLLRYVRGLVKRRRSEGGEDLVAALVRAEESGSQLSDDELLSMVMLLLIAGHETTVNLIASGTLALFDHPEAMESLAQEPARMPSAVEELLRFTCPVELATERYTTAPVTYSGHTIPRGQRVLASLASANHDPDMFAAPEQLKLAREPNRHLAFGGGPHYCLGAPLTRLEGQIAFRVLLRDLPGLRLAVPRGSLRWKPNQILRGLTALPVRCNTAPKHFDTGRRPAGAAGPSATTPAPASR
jgi:cytochrome P450